MLIIFPLLHCFATFLHFRRYITNETLFDTLLSSAWLSEEAHTALGGNAAVMANRFKQEGCHVLLGATVTNQLRDQIHPDIIGTIKQVDA